MTWEIAPFSRLGKCARDCGRDERATAVVEFAFIAPVVLMLMAMVVFAGQGFEIRRKVTLTLHTLTDLTTQESNIGLSQPSNINSSEPGYTYTQILNAASLVVAPYDSSQVSMALAEIKTNGTTAGSLQWCRPAGSSLCPSASPTLPASLENSGYLIYGIVQYNYNPLNIWFQAGTFTLSESIYMAPRGSNGVACCN